LTLTEALTSVKEPTDAVTVTEVGLPTVRLPPLMVSTPSDPRALTLSEPVGVMAAMTSPAWVRSIPVGANVRATGTPTQTCSGGRILNPG